MERGLGIDWSSFSFPVRVLVPKEYQRTYGSSDGHRPGHSIKQGITQEFIFCVLDLCQVSEGKKTGREPQELASWLAHMGCTGCSCSKQGQVCVCGCVHTDVPTHRVYAWVG